METSSDKTTEILPESVGKRDFADTIDDSPPQNSNGSGSGGEGSSCCEMNPKPVYCPIRYVVVGLACVGMVLVNAMRTNVGFTVMTILDERAHEKVGSVLALVNLPDVKWDTLMIGLLHSIFYMGYLITHIPGGYLATKLPCHRIYGGSVLLSCALNVLLPVSIEEISFTFTCVVRFCQGLSEGLLYPACYGILRHWSTPQERGRVGSAVLTGAYLGAVIGFPVAGFITHYIGWQYIYYVNGGAGIVWVLLWLGLSCEKPSHHRLISDTELEFLAKSQGDGVVDYEGAKLPWRQILTSPAVISLCMCHFARNWVFILMLTNEPFYLSLFGFNIAENGVFSSIPHAVKVVTAALSGYIADYLMMDDMLTTTDVRKLLTGIAFGVQALGFFILTFMYHAITVMIFLSLAVGFGGFAVSGWQINHYDLSTRHASFLVGITSTVGNLGAIAAPLVTGAVTLKEDMQSWKDVFYITTAVAGAACLSFIICGSGQQQPWANPPDRWVLVQKEDPLARKSYKLYSQQSGESTDTDWDEKKAFALHERPKIYGTDSLASNASDENESRESNGGKVKSS